MNKFLLFLVIILAGTTAYLFITQEAQAPAAEEQVASSSVSTNIEEKVNEEPVVQTSAQPTAPAAAARKTVPVLAEKTTPAPSKYDEDGNIIVRYTTYGFTPQTVEIKPGDAVHFINDNIFPMWVKAQAHPTAEYFEYAALNEGRSAYQGESYIFTFTQIGSWGYANLNNDKHKGVVIVTG